MARRKETECEDPAWLNSPEKAEIDQLIRDIEKQERERKMQQVTDVLRQIGKGELQNRKERR